jgi:phosphohistidine phosphatase
MVERPDYFYIQSAVIAFRSQGDSLHVLMITSRKRKRWVIPKGVKEPDLSAQDSAAKEALEEAGVTGRVLPQAIGRYRYQKWGGICTVDVFAMEVDEVLEQWEESFRDREWLVPAMAALRVEEPELKEILRSFPTRLKNLATGR